MAGKPHRKKGRVEKGQANAGLPGASEIERIKLSQPTLTDAEMAADERETAAAIVATKQSARRLLGGLQGGGSAQPQSEDRIVERFSEAVKQAQPADRWAWPVLTVALVTCAIAATLWLNRRTIMDLQSDVISLGRRYHMALADRARIEGIADDAHAANALLIHDYVGLKQRNAALVTQNEADVQRWSDDEASMHAASRDISRAEAVLQRAQAKDEYNDRAPMAMVLRALERAEKRLKQ